MQKVELIKFEVREKILKTEDDIKNSKRRRNNQGRCFEPQICYINLSFQFKLIAPLIAQIFFHLTHSAFPTIKVLNIRNIVVHKKYITLKYDVRKLFTS